MRKQVDATGVVTVVLLGVAAVLLCAQLTRLPALFAMDQGQALVLELLLYAFALALSKSDCTPRGYLIGVGAMFLFRLLITAGTMAWLAGQTGAPVVKAGAQVWTSAPARLAAVVFALLMSYPLAGLLPERPRRRRQPLPALVRQELLLSAAAAPREVELPSVEDEEPAGFGYVPHLTQRTVRPIEGKVQVPAEAISSQLPASLLLPGGPSYQGEVEVPLALVMPGLQEGEVKLALPDLVPYLPAGLVREDLDLFTADDAPTVSLPLEVVVPQLPDHVLEREPVEPPTWLRVDPALERTLFARA